MTFLFTGIHIKFSQIFKLFNLNVLSLWDFTLRKIYALNEPKTMFSLKIKILQSLKTLESKLLKNTVLYAGF